MNNVHIDIYWHSKIKLWDYLTWYPHPNPHPHPGLRDAVAQRGARRAAARRARRERRVSARAPRTRSHLPPLGRRRGARAGGGRLSVRHRALPRLDGEKCTIYRVCAERSWDVRDAPLLVACNLHSHVACGCVELDFWYERYVSGTATRVAC